MSQSSKNSLVLLKKPRFELTKDTALILEGGGFRGISTAGILDRFLEEEIHFPYNIGVSMGAIIGMCYVADQHRRVIDWCSKYIPDKKYMSFNNLIKEGNFFSHDYGFNREARRYIPFDFKNFYNAPDKFFFTTTDVNTGLPRYFEKREDDVVKLSLATSALPAMSRFIPIQNGLYLDGGISDAIPILKPLEDGNKKLVVVLTRQKGYRKGPYKENLLGNFMYKNYPNLLKAFEQRNEAYNSTLDLIDKLEKEGKAFVFYTNDDADSVMIQRDPEVLRHNYQYGYSQADVRMDEFKEFLKKDI